MDARYTKKIIRSFERPDPEIVAEFSLLYTGIVADVLGKLGVMHVNLGPLSPGMTICGPATTSFGPDLTVRRMAIDLAAPGDVLVVAAGGIRDYACFGDGTARRMMTKKMAGAVIDGCTRDAAGLRRVDFPTFSLGVTSKNYHYPESGDYGAVNVPVVCAGVSVSPGDIILGDDDGVVAVPASMAYSVLEEARKNLAEENQIRDSWNRYVPFDVAEELHQRGYSYE